MTLIALKLAPSIYDKIRSYVEKGLYVSPEQFLEIAAFNQVALEAGARPDEIVSRGHRRTGESKDTLDRPRHPQKTARKVPKRPRVGGANKAAARLVAQDERASLLD